MLRLILITPFFLLSMVLVLPVLIIICPLWLFVFLCKKVDQSLMLNGVTKWNEIIQYDAKIGWNPYPLLNDVKYQDPVGEIGTITTDSLGWPLSKAIEDSNIVVFGDSFAFGFGSKLEDTYYGKENGVNIKPIAAPGYNMVQELLLMEKYSEKLEGKLIFWFVCLENDLVENLKPYNSKNYTNPFLRINGGDNWEIVTEHLQPHKWEYAEEAKNTLHFAEICTESPYSKRVFSSVHFLLDRAKGICDSVGAELVVFTIPDKRQLSGDGVKSFKKHLDKKANFNADYPDERFGNICRDLNIPFIAGKSHLTDEDYKIFDPHWNKKGNKKVSQVIKDYYTTVYKNGNKERGIYVKG